jgi:hypothetical protein
LNVHGGGKSAGTARPRRFSRKSADQFLSWNKPATGTAITGARSDRMSQSLGRAILEREVLVRVTRPRLASRWFVWLIGFAGGILGGLLAETACAQTPSDNTFQFSKQAQAMKTDDADCKILYVGIVGGLETPNNKRSGIVQVRDTLRDPAYTEVCARTFSPYDWMAGRSWILSHFPQHTGPMTEIELGQAPKVVLACHSLGGWAVISVARSLDREGIPVELTVQVDSVGITDHTVPKNVKEAAIFHARDILMFMTTKEIKTEDANRTKLVANIRVEGVGHESITRDPRIRELVLRTINSLKAETASATLGRTDRMRRRE